ncbi:structural maintenance of chromosomes protein 1 [Tanacetum coccineum]
MSREKRVCRKDTIGNNLYTTLPLMWLIPLKTAPNLKAIDQYAALKEKERAASKEYHNARNELNKISEQFKTMRTKRLDCFKNTFKHIYENLDEIYKHLTKRSTHKLDGNVYLNIENDNEPFSHDTHVIPPTKRFWPMDLLSGGEKTVAALALLFSIHSGVGDNGIPCLQQPPPPPAIGTTDKERVRIVLVGNLCCKLSSTVENTLGNLWCMYLSLWDDLASKVSHREDTSATFVLLVLLVDVKLIMARDNIEEASEGQMAGQRLALCKFILTNRTPIGGMKGKALSQLISIYKTVEGVEKDINIYLKTAHKSFKDRVVSLSSSVWLEWLLGRTNLETMLSSLVGMAVGKDKFRDDAKQKMVGAQMKTNDPTTSNMLQVGIGQAMQVSGQDFLPYMAVVVPPLLRSAQLKPDVITSADSDYEIDSDDERKFSDRLQTGKSLTDF